MPDLLIRDLDAPLHRRLKARARAHGRSLALEAREILRAAIAREESAPASENLVAIATRLFGPRHGVELELPSRSADIERPPPDFGGPEYDR